jgi:hypothetical protein
MRNRTISTTPEVQLQGLQRPCPHECGAKPDKDWNKIYQNQMLFGSRWRLWTLWYLSPTFPNFPRTLATRLHFLLQTHVLHRLLDWDQGPVLLQLLERRRQFCNQCWSHRTVPPDTFSFLNIIFIVQARSIHVYPVYCNWGDTGSETCWTAMRLWLWGLHAFWRSIDPPVSRWESPASVPAHQRMTVST